MDSVKKFLMHSISFTVCSENTVWIGSEVENEVRDRERRKAIVIVVQGEKQEARVRNEFLLRSIWKNGIYQKE